MPDTDQLDQWDHQHSWHPFSQMQEYCAWPKLHVERGEGCWLWDSEGKRYLDTNASVWTNTFGHNDPELNAALTEQLGKVAHSTYLGLSHPAAAELGQRLCAEAPDGLERVFFSDNGSNAIEVTCLAPFTAFCEEQQRGGTTPLASLRLLQKRVETQPEKAIKLFYRLAGLTDEPTDQLPYPVEHLRCGLEQLADLQVDTTLLCRVKGYVGLTDALVRGTMLQSQWANCDLIENCSHSYNELFATLPLIKTF